MRAGKLEDVSYWPDHTAPMTWFRCIAPGCEERVDPWDHNTRCPIHRPADDATGDATRAHRRKVARTIVEEYRRHARV